jgi:hypothetical protein
MFWSSRTRVDSLIYHRDWSTMRNHICCGMVRRALGSPGKIAAWLAQTRCDDLREVQQPAASAQTKAQVKAGFVDACLLP